ncbi:hypothetical protein D3C85_1567430 [compost metagenome]
MGCSLDQRVSCGQRQLSGFLIVGDHGLVDLHGEGDRGDLAHAKSLSALEHLHVLQVVDAARVDLKATVSLLSH